MAVQLQADKGWSVDSNGKKVKRFSVLGITADVEEFAAANPKGSTIAGYGQVVAIDVIGGVGDSATARYTCAVLSASGGEPDPDEPLTDVWNLSNTRVEIPIEAYCGPSPAVDASLRHIQLWRQEPDITLWLAYKFKSPDGTIVDLNALANPKTRQMAEMIASGQEVVVRYYPLITRRRTYVEMPHWPLTIGSIEAPDMSVSGFTGQWLKITEDIDQGTDGVWNSVEQWQGADSYRAEFYGAVVATRWKVGGSSAI